MEIITGTTIGRGYCTACQTLADGVTETRIPFRKKSVSPNSYFMDLCGDCRKRLEQPPALVPDEGRVNTTSTQIFMALA